MIHSTHQNLLPHTIMIPHIIQDVLKFLNNATYTHTHMYEKLPADNINPTGSFSLLFQLSKINIPPNTPHYTPASGFRPRNHDPAR